MFALSSLMAGHSAPTPWLGEENEVENQLSRELMVDSGGQPPRATQACSWESGEERPQAVGAAYVWPAAGVSWFPRLPVD